MIATCGSCLTAEFADDDSDDEETVLVAPGSKTGHLRRPSGSEVRSTFGKMAQLGRGSRDYTYCGRPIGVDWTASPRP
jgi:hypothetical protein